MAQAREDADARARRVLDEEGHRAARVPCLMTLGFSAYLRGLQDEEIRQSYTLPIAPGKKGKAAKTKGK